MEKKMTKQEIYNAISLLALGNGFYGRILRAIEDGTEEDKNSRLEYLESIGFRDKVDLVLYLEG